MKLSAVGQFVRLFHKKFTFRKFYKYMTLWPWVLYIGWWLILFDILLIMITNNWPSDGHRRRLSALPQRPVIIVLMKAPLSHWWPMANIYWNNTSLIVHYTLSIMWIKHHSNKSGSNVGRLVNKLKRITIIPGAFHNNNKYVCKVKQDNSRRRLLLLLFIFIIIIKTPFIDW